MKLKNRGEGLKMGGKDRIFELEVLKFSRGVNRRGLLIPRFVEIWRGQGKNQC